MNSSKSHGPHSADAVQSPVPLIDVQNQYEQLKPEIDAAIAQVCASGRYVMGPEVDQLEESVARYCDAEHAVACASGSDALLLALMALDVGPGDEVVMPSFTFFATASAVWRLGAKPVFVDIDPATCNLDVQAVADAVTPATKAVIPVHLYGQCADMEPLWRLAVERRLAVIEDSCQAIGAEYGGRRTGVLGDMACFSFYPTKNLGCFGDGGMVTTNDATLASQLKLLRSHGMQPRYYHKVVGINSRLDTIQAAVLNIKLTKLDAWTDARAKNAAQYRALFAACGFDGELSMPVEAENRRHVWNQFMVRVADGRRDALRDHLKQRQIGTEVYYPVPLHQQECFRTLGCGGLCLPETEKAAVEVMAVPIFAELTLEQQVRVVSGVASFYGQNVDHKLAKVARNLVEESRSTEPKRAAA